MSLLRDITYKGIPIKNAVYTVDTITIQGGQLDFFVSIRASKDAPLLDGETHGCVYNPEAGTPEEQAYAYLKSLDEYKDAVEG